MTDEGHYQPKSDFLIMIANEEIVLDDSEFGQANLRRLISFTLDDDTSNRDWATMLLGHHGPHTDEIRDVLLRAADDEDQYVRAEAIEALVERDRASALRLVRRELGRESVGVGVFDAAAALADASLVSLLEPFSEPSGDDYVDEIAKHALNKCQEAKRDPSTRSA